MDLLSVIEIVKGAVELANIPKQDSAKPQNNREIQALQNLVNALRRIYFSPKGVLLLLNEIANGGYPSEEKISLILPEFNEGEHWVRQAQHDLNSSGVMQRASLTLKAERVLSEIAYGKGGIRTKVQMLLNESLTYAEKISVEEARQLIKEIKMLNEAIENAEEALVAMIK